MIRLLLASLIVLIAACQAESPSISQPVQPTARSKMKFDAPDEAEALYRMKRMAPEGMDPQRLYDAARRQMARMRRYATANDRVLAPATSRLAEEGVAAARQISGWEFLGPGNIGGRTRALLIDPRNADVIYAGGVSGGIWKTSNGGGFWKPIGDNLANLAVNSMAMHPEDSTTLYAGTGEGYFREELRGTALPLRGDGIFRTRNGGDTWEHLASTRNSDFHWVNDVVVSRRDPRRVYAATRTGVWRSSDEGETWRRILGVVVKGGCLDLEMRTDAAGDYLFASCGIYQQATVFRHRNAETDTGWEIVLNASGMSRTSLAIAPSNPSVVYALSASNNPGPQRRFDQGLLAVYRSDRNGDPGSWVAVNRNDDSVKLDTLLLTNPLSGGPGCPGSFGSYVGMGWHCNVISVDPTNPDIVWAAGVDLFRSDDGGRTWGLASYWWAPTTTPSFVHADQHAIAFHPSYDGEGNQIVFVANDGGVFKTANARDAVAYGAENVCRADATNLRWESLNHNFGATQFYHGTPFPDGKRWAGGAQDNGTLLGTVEQGTDGWSMIWGGDGGHVAIDPTNPNVIYAESQGGNIVKSVDGGQTFGFALNGLSPQGFLFIAPFLIDPNRNTRLWTGSTQMYRTDDGAGLWSAASAPLPAQVSAIAVAPGNPDAVLAGTNNGSIARTDRATTATAETQWTVVRPRTGFVSSLAFDPSDANVAYATYAGFGGGAHVWRSDDGGATWVSLDGTGDGALPDIPIHSLAIDPTRPERLFLGTDLGVFASIDGGAQWYVENSGFAAVVTETVTIGQGARGPAIYAFTHGRGAWRAELTEAPQRRRATRR
jgi:photosystem II stability/assembly factor-like uncharacterized protein